jgi:hypothetical protein
MKSFFLSLFFISVAPYAFAQYTETINSNRPGASFGAYSVGTNVIQAEGGIGFGNDTHDLLNTDTDNMFFDYALRYGLLFEQLELILEGRFVDATQTFPFGTGTEENSFRNFETNTFGIKYLFFDPNKS